MRLDRKKPRKKPNVVSQEDESHSNQLFPGSWGRLALLRVPPSSLTSSAAAALRLEDIFLPSAAISRCLPSHLGMGPLHMTLPLSSWQETVSLPCVLMKPSSHTTEMELPSWKLSPKRRALIGMPGSGHSLCPNAAVKSTKKRGGRMSEAG